MHAIVSSIPIITCKRLCLFNCNLDQAIRGMKIASKYKDGICQRYIITKRERILHIIWKLIFQRRVLKNPSTKVRLTVVYMIINWGFPILSEIRKAERKERNIKVKSLGLSSLFVTLRSDVIPKTLKSTIDDIGITQVNSIKSNPCPKVNSMLEIIAREARNTKESVTTLENTFATISLTLSFFILLSSMSIPDIRKRTESKSDVSNIQKYSLSILNVFISNLIKEYEMKYIPVVVPSVLYFLLIIINITKVKRFNTDSYKNTGWKWV